MVNILALKSRDRVPKIGHSWHSKLIPGLLEKKNGDFQDACSHWIMGGFCSLLAYILGNLL